MTDQQSSLRSPLLFTPSKETPGTSARGFFPPQTTPELSEVKQLSKFIRQDLAPADEELGYVYVLQHTDETFFKVGLSKEKPQKRCKAIGKRCHIHVKVIHYTHLPFCAHRAEQIVHKLLHRYNHIMENCPCHHRHHEWFQLNRTEVVQHVEDVFSWLHRQPYDMNTRKLKPVWEHGLEVWNATQTKRKPLAWRDFFLADPSLDPRTAISSTVKSPFKISPQIWSTAIFFLKHMWGRRKPSFFRKYRKSLCKR